MLILSVTMAATTSSPVLSDNGSEASASTGISSSPRSSMAPPSTEKSSSLPTIFLQRPEPPKHPAG
ncbi:hypothetical protein BVRB_1g022870 [Beta vulgaris subsp. vulgaris]|uniref:Uncharacterized protein n=1 Tax=Beta vulgaris subsp. vulgaris TaxID=3555 RepID=A0A0J8E8Y7_BETVV|nr:hypothetical protein BVRB_1g022870 [Beta vulgaris subsp. vulgaris]